MVALLAAVIVASPASAGHPHPAPVGHHPHPDETFDLELQDAEIHSTIRMLADLGDLDVVIPDTVYGRVTIKLVDVTWETALAAVLSVEGLAAVPTGPDALRIAPLR